jgi:hypothetical protein
MGIATFGTIGGGLLMILIAASCFFTCFQTRAMLRAEGPWGFQEEDTSTMDYSASLFNKADSAKSRKAAQRASQRAEKLAREEQVEQQRIDAILSKVSAHGMHSLTWLEKRTLKKATEHQRQRDMERLRKRRVV